MKCDQETRYRAVTVNWGKLERCGREPLKNNGFAATLLLAAMFVSTTQNVLALIRIVGGGAHYLSWAHSSLDVQEHLHTNRT
jgi:hypothetical protein